MFDHNFSMKLFVRIVKKSILNFVILSSLSDYNFFNFNLKIFVDLT